MLNRNKEFSQGRFNYLRNLVLAVAVAGLVACGGGGSSSSGGGRSLSSQKPAIVGPAAFVQQIEHAIRLLPAEDLQFVYQYTSAIEYTEDYSRAEPGERTMIADRELGASDTWLASVIVHEACHHKQLQETGRNCGVVYEQQCNSRLLSEASPRDLQALRNMGASQHEVDYANSLDGTHGPCA